MGFFSVGGVAEGGLVPDHPAYDLPPHVFSAGIDIEFTDDGIRPMVKEVEVFPGVLANPLHLNKIKLGATDSAFVYLSTSAAFIVQNGLHSVITRIAGDGGAYNANDQIAWNNAILHGIPVYNNGVDQPQQLDISLPTAPLKNLANWPSNIRTEVLRPYLNFLVAIRIKTGSGPYDQQSIIWSNAADPGSVPPDWNFLDPASLSGLFTFSETDDRLVDGLRLGNEFIIYKERSIYAMRFVGGTFVMSIKRRPGDIGLLTQDCVVEYPGGHFFIGQDDLYTYNGSGVPQSVAEGRIRRKFFTELTRGQKSKCFVSHDPSRKSIFVFYPSNGSLWPDRCAVWRYNRNTWTFRTVPQVASVTFGTVNTLVQNTWDDFIEDWDNDSSAWNNDQTIWDEVSAWDAASAGFIWDQTSFEPIVEDMIMATHLESPAVFDSLTNTSSADGVTWSGSSEFPPFWLIPSEGVRLQGQLVRTGFAFIGKDHKGNFEVNRTVTKILTEYYPEVLEGAVEIRFGTQETPTGAVDWDAFVKFDPDVDAKLDPFISGKFLAIEIQGTGEGDGEWLLSGHGFEINLGGRY